MRNATWLLYIDRIRKIKFNITMGMEQKPQDFDAHIVAVFDQLSIASDPCSPSPSLLWIDKNHEQPVDMKAHWFLRCIQEPSDDLTLFLRQAGDALIDVPEPLLDAIFYGRVRLTMLLNQRGGNMFSLFNLFDIAGDIRTRGGSVVSMVTQRAQSAVAHMTELCNKRIALPHSDYMWHASHDGQGNAIEDAQQKSKDIMTMLRYHLYPVAIPIVEQRFRTAMDDPNNPLNNMHAKGSELYEWGFVHELSSSTKQMEQQFQYETGIGIDLQAWPQDPIARFFLRSRMEEWALLEHDLRMELYHEQPDQLFYNIPERQERQFANDDHIDAIINLTYEKFKEYF